MFRSPVATEPGVPNRKKSNRLIATRRTSVSNISSNRASLLNMLLIERVSHTSRRSDSTVGGTTYCDSHPSPSIRLVESTGQRPFRQTLDSLAYRDVARVDGRAVANRRLDSR